MIIINYLIRFGRGGRGRFGAGRPKADEEPAETPV